MALVTLERLARALDVGPHGAAVAVFGRGRPCLEPVATHAAYRLHRHRAGARKVRRILRRQQQRSFAAWAAREGAETTSLRDFERPRGWLGKNWRWTP